MRGLFKALIAIVVVLVVLIAAAALLLPRLVDPNQYKGLITEQVQKLTGRTLTIKGQIGLTVFPTLGLTIGGVELSPAQGFGAEPMVSLEQAQVRVQLMPLLSRQVVADKVVVVKPVIRVGRDKTGRMAWDDILEKLSAGKGPEAKQAEPAAKGQALDVNVAGLMITDGKLVWADAKENRTASIDALNVDLGALAPGRAVPASVSCAFSANDPQAKGAVSFKGTVTADTAAQKAKVDKGQLSLTLDQFAQKAAKGPARKLAGKLSVNVDADVDYGKGVAALKGLSVTNEMSGDGLPFKAAKLALATPDATVNWAEAVAALKGMTLSADVAGSEGFKTLKASGGAETTVNWGKTRASLKGLKISMDGTGLGAADSLAAALTATDLGVDWGGGDLTSRGLNLKADLKGDKLPGKTASVAFVADSADVDYQQGTANIPSFSLTADELKVTGGITTTQTGGKPAASGRINVAPFSPRQLMAKLGMTPPATSDPNAFSKAQLDMNLSMAPKAVHITDLKAVLDDSQINGRASVADFSSPDIGFDLGVNTLDADRYMPPKGAAPKDAPKPAEPAKGGDSALKKLTVNGTARVGSLKAMNVRAQNVLVTVRGKDGVFRIDPLSADMYQGKVNAALSADMGGPELRDPAMKLNIGGLQIGPFLQDYLGRMGWIGGATDLKLDAKSDGGSGKELMKTLSGLGDVVVRHGILRGFTIVPGAVDNLMNASQGFNMNNGTSFDQLGGAFNIQRGKLDFTSLFMVSKDGRVEAPGASFDLAGEKANVPLKMLSDKLPTIKGSPIQLKEIPLQLSGSFDNLQLGVNQQGLQESIANAAKGAVQQKIQEKIGGAIPGGLIPGLGGQQQQPAQPQPGQQQPKPQTPTDKLKEGLGNILGH